jgi:TolA-binding protein
VETVGQIDFEAELADDLALVNRSADRPTADVLYRLGLLYAHYENPKKDYKKAAIYMQRLVNEFPDSLLVGEARIWLGVFDAIRQLQQVDIDIEEKKKELSQ